MAFWGQKLRAGQICNLELPRGGILHLSQACLGENPSAGRTFLQAQVQGGRYNLACLDRDRQESVPLDLFFAAGATSFTCSGPNELHITGYIEPDDGDDEDARPSTEVAAPAAAAVAKSSPQAPKAQPSPKAAVAKSSTPAAKAASPKPASSPKPPVTAAAAAKAAAATMAQDDDSDSDIDILDEGEEGPEEEEKVVDPIVEPEDDTPVAAKRKPEATAGQASPSKKARASPKVAAGTAGGVQASPKVAASPATSNKSTGAASGGNPEEEQEYIKRVVDFLKTNGKVHIGQLGSSVPKPSSIKGLKTFLDKHDDTFVVRETQVELKK